LPACIPACSSVLHYCAFLHDPGTAVRSQNFIRGHALADIVIVRATLTGTSWLDREWFAQGSISCCYRMLDRGFPKKAQASNRHPALLPGGNELSEAGRPMCLHNSTGFPLPASGLSELRGQTDEDLECVRIFRAADSLLNIEGDQFPPRSLLASHGVAGASRTPNVKINFPRRAARPRFAPGAFLSFKMVERWSTMVGQNTKRRLVLFLCWRCFWPRTFSTEP